MWWHDFLSKSSVILSHSEPLAGMWFPFHLPEQLSELERWESCCPALLLPRRRSRTFAHLSFGWEQPTAGHILALDVVSGPGSWDS